MQPRVTCRSTIPVDSSGGTAMNSMIRRSVLAVAGVTALGAALAQDGLADRFTEFTKNSSWELVSNDLLDFDTHHPQGMVRVGDSLFLSSVEIIERTGVTRRPRTVTTAPRVWAAAGCSG